MKIRNKRKIALLLIMLLFSFGIMEYIVPPQEAYAAVKLNKSKLSMKTGAVYQLAVKGTKSSVKWSSSNKKVVTVSAKGKVKAVNPGSAVVNAKAGKKNLKCVISVSCRTHEWDEGTITTAADCLQTGIRTYICTACGQTETEEISKTTHNYEKDSTVAAQKESIGYTKYVCSICGGTREDDITYYQPTQEQAYADIMAMKSEYPEGRPWTNSNGYGWSAGFYAAGYGCMGFSFAMSDAAFGIYPPASKHSDLDNLKVGDIIFTNNATHSVVVLEVDGDTITVAEGNYNSSIHWGRKLSKSALKNDSKLYILTRYQ